MNYFKSAEQVLSSVPMLERALENLESRRARLIANGAPREPGAIDYTKPFTGSNYVNDTLNDLLELSECVNNIAKTNAELDEIKAIVAQLQPDQKTLVELWYFEKYSKEVVMDKMQIDSLSTVYNLRNKAVAEFALLYYGAAALPSI